MNRRRGKLARAGRPQMVDAEPARRWVRALMAAGKSYPTVAAEAGLSRSTVGQLIGHSGRYPTKIRRPSAEAILRVTADDAPRGMVDACGVRRRVQALVATGRTVREIAAEVGVCESYLGAVTRRDELVRRGLSDRVKVVYERWRWLPPTGRTAETARRRARLAGFPSPLAWDTDTIDDPFAAPDTGTNAEREPDESEVAELVAGRKPADWATQASRTEAYRRLFASGLNAREVAERLQVSERTAERVRARLGPRTAETEEAA